MSLNLSDVAFFLVPECLGRANVLLALLFGPLAALVTGSYTGTALSLLLSSIWMLVRALDHRRKGEGVERFSPALGVFLLGVAIPMGEQINNGNVALAAMFGAAVQLHCWLTMPRGDY